MLDGGVGKLSFTKTGGGKLTLSGANSYTGNTTVTAGILSLGASNVIPDGSAVVLNGGNLTTGSGQTETAASLSLSAASTITLGGTFGSTSILTFTGGVAGSSGISAINTLSIWNWNGSLSGGGEDRLVVPVGSLNATELENISFYSGTDNTGFLGTAAFAPGGEVVPVPEPGTMTLAAALLLAGTAFGRGRSQAARRR